MPEDQIHDGRGFLPDLIHFSRLHTGLPQRRRRASCGIDDITQLLEAAGQPDGLAFIRVFHGYDHLFMFGQIHARPQKCLIQRFIKGPGYPQAFSRGFHLRPQADLRAADLLKGKDRHLHGVVIRRRLQPRFIAQIPDLFPDDHFRGKIHDRDSRHLADIGYGPGRTRIHLDHIHLVVHGDKLDVDQADHMQCLRQPSGILRDGLLHLLADRGSRVHRDTVPGMDAGALDMFHNARNQDIGAVANRIHLQLFALQVFVHQNRMFLLVAVDDRHKFFNLLI